MVDMEGVIDWSHIAYGTFIILVYHHLVVVVYGNPIFGGELVFSPIIPNGSIPISMVILTASFAI